MRQSELQKILDHYRRRYLYSPSYFSDELADPEIRIFIVIPVYDENLDGIMKSLSHCQAAVECVRVILVFNNAEGSVLTKKHKAQAEEWHNVNLNNGLKVSVIEALSLPHKHAGVGLARKIGMDAALAAFTAIARDGLIVCLDADCMVKENYLQELLRVECLAINGLSIYFEHPLTDLEEKRQEQIIYYEIWLRYYIQALRSIGYPHAFHTIGSSMAVRASVYARIGGMNRRQAGEDFYFLHKLIPQGGFFDLTTTAVYPSARDSLRVPFGTGRAMIDMQEGRKDFSRLYDPEIFRLISPLFKQTDRVMKDLAQADSGPLATAINALGWPDEWLDLMSRSKTKKSFQQNFTYWFNGFRMLKLVHWLREYNYPDIHFMDAVHELLNIHDQESRTLLKTLRELDRNCAFNYL